MELNLKNVRQADEDDIRKKKTKILKTKAKEIQKILNDVGWKELVSAIRERKDNVV